MTIVVLTGLQEEADIFKGLPGVLVLCGAAQRDNLPNLIPPDAEGLVSAGCAGALAPDVKIGDAYTASSMVDLYGNHFLPDLTWRKAVSQLGDVYGRVFFSHPTEVAATPEEKAKLQSTLGADVVDEETWAVAYAAKNANLPWMAIRTISDTADQTILPHDAQAQNPDGSTNIGPVIGDALQNPGEAIREAEGFEKSLDALRRLVKALGPRLGKPT